MKKRKVRSAGILLLILLSIAAMLYPAGFDKEAGFENWEEEEEEAEGKNGRLSGADKQLNGWFLAKGYPDPSRLSDKYEEAWEQHLTLRRNTDRLIGQIRTNVNQSGRSVGNNIVNGIEAKAIQQQDAQLSGVIGSGGFGNWKMIGPKAFGGRMLSLAINPRLHADGKRTIYAGSASGGIWRSYVDGEGANAWHPVATNLPVLGVSAIVYHPTDTSILYAGTGEVYRVETLTTSTSSTNQTGNIGMNVWKCRGTYGIGILKSTDGGRTWSRVYSKRTDELFAIQSIRIDPSNPNKIYACATDGLYRSADAGATWSKVMAAVYVSDVAINPGNGNQVVVAVGNMKNGVKGLWRTVDGFATAPIRLNTAANGIPSSYSGYTKFDAIGSGLLLASFTGISNGGNEIYFSSDFGLNWEPWLNSAFANSQYWFANDIELNPTNANEIIAAGVNTFRIQKTFDKKGLPVWNRAQIGTGSATMNSFVANGSQEGASSYVHDDVHDIEYVPGSGDYIYMATDGGIFLSKDNGSTFQSCNGGLQVHQFYGPIAQSQIDGDYFIGGLQDNNVIRSNNTNTGWSRVVPGDGGPCMFVPGTNEQTVIASRDARTIYYSSDGGATYSKVLANMGLDISPAADERTGFMAPIAVSPASGNTVYVASDNLHVSINGGQSFSKSTLSSMTSPIDLIYKTAVALAVSNSNSKKLYVSVSPIAQKNDDGLHYNPPSNVFRSTDGGSSFVKITNSLPDRFIMDFAVSATNDDSVFAAVGGFGTQHIYVTGDGGSTWKPLGSGLPDAPINTVLIDPANPKVLYAGSDLGVYVSPDRGQNWYDFSSGFWDATYVIDLVSAPGGKLRAVTHGKGIFETDLFKASVLPVTFTTLRGSVMADHNLLTWNVASEADLDYYQVERSLDGAQFNAIGRIAAKNQSGVLIYQYRDFKATYSAYYRVRSIDLDGTYQFSPVIHLAGGGNSKMTVLQNPFVGQLKIRFDLNQRVNGSIRLIASSGAVVKVKELKVHSGVQVEMLDVPELTAGVYYLEATLGRYRWVEKVIKQ